MKSILRKGHAPDLDRRLQALQRAVEIGGDRFEPSLVDDARSVLERGTERMSLGAGVTVVALAGATGSGKSSLFNRLSGADLAAVGVRRPTTSSAQAAVWGEASELLDWLGVARRHRLDDPELDGLVLLDLPDHDSTEVDHRLEVDRLVQLVDVFVWVVDPQKYADAALHEGYLRPLATHAAVSVVVLNQMDRLSEGEAAQCANDLTRLLKREGLGGAQVLTTSAATGRGLDALRQTIAERVRRQRAAAQRLGADLDRLAGRLAPLCGTGKVAALPEQERARLIDALEAAAGVDVVVNALTATHRRDAALKMGWPFTRWLRRFRPDPLGRLHLSRAAEGGRTSLPQATAVQRARLDSALRHTATSAGAGLPDPWPHTVKRSVAASTGGLLDDLDAAVSSTDLAEQSRPRWWSVAGWLQAVLAGTAVVGFVWLTVLFGLQWLQIPQPPTPQVEGIPWPTIALAGGLLAGFVLSLLFRLLVGVGARRRGRRARQRLREGVARVAGEKVVAPLQAELDAYREFCGAVRALERER